MPYLNLNDQLIFYTFKEGDPDLPVVVLVHGAGSSHLGWPPGLRRLPDFAVMGVDLPGHGRSHPPGRSSIDEYANDIAALLSQQKIGQAVLIGHSMGGAIAQTLALSQPDVVAGLVLIGTGAKLPVSDLILAQTLTDFTAVTNFISQFSWSPAAPPPLVAKGHQELLKTAPDVLLGDFVACNTFDVRDQLGKIDVPTLVTAGSIDKMTPPKFGRYLAEQIPGAALHIVENSGHWMMLEQADEVTAVITQFLQQFT
ncbi:MAG: alpha/beta hydrolase [Ardenticatenaceae bacterium]|nr:alpha/beta hydrolase [Ardenticatenaceae bacterium]